MKACVIWLLAGAALALEPASGPAHRPVELRRPVQDKNFFLLSLVEREPAVRAAIQQDSTLAGLRADRAAAINRAVSQCGADLECNTIAFRWTDEQISRAAAALAGLYRTSAATRALTDGPLRLSGMWVRYQDLSSGDLLARAWSDCVRGINHTIDVYGLGKPPRYPPIDAITYDPKGDSWRRIVHHLVTLIEDDRPSLDLPWSGSLRFALELMAFNHRDEAGRFEPLEAGENAAAFRRVKSIDWNRYPYSVIVVPGSGNDRPGVRFSPNGMIRDEIAVKRFREGKAPFLLVSGGFVHPSQTEFCEAIEMKRDLMTRFGIREDAIIVDPHARHTTTNLRNAARLLYRYGIPFDRKALVTSDPSQSQYIEAAGFAKRCTEELGYMPVRLLGRKSAFDLEFLPLADSLQADAIDPLDP